MSFGFGFSLPAYAGYAASFGPSSFGAGTSLALDFLNGNNTLDPRITFSRTSNATLTNSAGVLTYAPHNLLTFSEQFDNAAWAKSGASVTANSTAAPDGAITADKLVEDTSTGGHRVAFASGAGSTVSYAYSVFIKAAERNWARLLLDDTGNGVEAYFDLTNGVVGSVNNIGTATGASASITSVGGGWYRCTLSGRPAASNVSGARAFVGTAPDNNVATFAGITGNGIFIWGAQLNVGALQPYYPTTVKNLLGFTQEFDNAAWSKVEVTIAANSTAAPDGSVTADTFVESTATTAHFTTQSATVISGTVYTLSTYAKNNGRAVQLAFGTGNFGSNAFANFDLSSGVVGSVGSAATATIQSVGNGWYRCAIAAPATTSGSAALVIYGTTTPSASRAPSYTGDGTSGIYIWGAQLSDSASLDPYVYNPVAAPASTAYYGPRFDYDPVTLAPKGLLIEEQRTNSIRNNTMQGAVAGTPGTLPTNWSVSGGAAAGLTRTVVGVGTEAGINYIDLRFQGTPSAGSLNIIFENAASAVTLNQVWAQSAYVSIVGGSLNNVSALNLRFDEGSPYVRTTTTTNISTLTSQLVRYSGAGTIGATTTQITGVYLNAFCASAPIDITIRIGLPQLELGAFATSPIPTTTAAATRAADVATMIGANFSNWYNQSEGTLCVEGTIPFVGGASFPAFASVDDGTSNEAIEWSMWDAASDSVRFVVWDGGVGQASIVAGTYSANTALKLAGAYKVNDFAAAYNGANAVTDTAGTLPTVTLLRIGQNRAAGNPLNGTIKRIAFYPRRLANSELQSITA